MTTERGQPSAGKGAIAIKAERFLRTLKEAGTEFDWPEISEAKD